MFSWTQINLGFLSCFGKRAWHPCDHRSEKGSVLPVVVAERKFVDVILQIFPAHRMVSTADAPLHLAPKALDSVSVNVAAHVLASAVVDLPMAKTESRGVPIDGKLVAVERRRSVNLAVNVDEDVRGCDGINNFCIDAAAAFRKPNDGSFPSGSPAAFAGPDASKVSFISFHNSHEFVGEAGGQQLADLVSHAPGALVGDAELPFEFLGCNSIAALSHEKNGEEPRLQRRFRLVENRTCGRIDLMPTKRAGVGSPLRSAMEAMRLPAHAKLIGKSALENVLKAGRIVGKFLIERFEIILHVFFSVSEEIKLRVRLRASREFAPPRVVGLSYNRPLVLRQRPLAARARREPPCIQPGSCRQLRFDAFAHAGIKRLTAIRGSVPPAVGLIAIAVSFAGVCAMNEAGTVLFRRCRSTLDFFRRQFFTAANAKHIFAHIFLSVLWGLGFQIFDFFRREIGAALAVIHLILSGDSESAVLVLEHHDISVFAVSDLFLFHTHTLRRNAVSVNNYFQLFL